MRLNALCILFYSSRRQGQGHFSDENTPPDNSGESDTSIEAAETLVAMRKSQDTQHPIFILHPSGLLTEQHKPQPALTEKINIIENIKLN